MTGVDNEEDDVDEEGEDGDERSKSTSTAETSDMRSSSFVIIVDGIVG